MYADVSVPRNNDLPLFFNVDGHVGFGCANHYNDVLLVQFMCHINGIGASSPLSRVPLNGICDARTVEAIRFIQQSVKKKGMVGTVVDGKVSPILNGKINYGGGMYTLAILNRWTRWKCSVWPRLQDLSNCPGKLADATSSALGCSISTRKL